MTAANGLWRLKQQLEVDGEDNLPNMRPFRQTQHRPKKEVQEVRQSELYQFRSENQRLRKEVSRLRREIEKYKALWDMPEDEEESMADKSDRAKKVDVGCLACGSNNIVEFAMSNKTLLICKDCKHRIQK